MDNSRGLGSLVNQGVLSRDLDKNNVMIGQEQPFYQSKGMALPPELEALLQAYRTTQQEVKKPQGNPAPTTVKEDIMGRGQPQMPQSPMGQAPMGPPPVMPNPREQGIAGLPQKAVGTKGFAAGGIVAFAEGGDPAQAAGGAEAVVDPELAATEKRIAARIAAGEDPAAVRASEAEGARMKRNLKWSQEQRAAAQAARDATKAAAPAAEGLTAGQQWKGLARGTGRVLGALTASQPSIAVQALLNSPNAGLEGEGEFDLAAKYAAEHGGMTPFGAPFYQNGKDPWGRTPPTKAAADAALAAEQTPDGRAELAAALAKMPKPNTGGGIGAILPNFSIPRTAQADPYAGVAGKIKADADRDTKSRVAERRKWDEEAGITGNEADYLAGIEAKRGKLSKEEEKAKWLDMAGRFADAGGQRNSRQAGLKILSGAAGAEAESGKRIKAANEAFDEATRKSKEATALRARGDYEAANKAQAEADKAMLEVTKAQAEYSQKDRQQEQQAQIAEGQINATLQGQRLQAQQAERQLLHEKGTESDLAEYRALDKIIMSPNYSAGAKAAAKANQQVILKRVAAFSLAGGADTLAVAEARKKDEGLGLGGSPAISAIDAELAKRGK